MKRKGVTLVLLWEEYRAAHPDGYGDTWFCERYREFESRVSPRYRNRHEAGAVMQTDYAGHTIPVIDPGTGAEHRAQIFVAVPGASHYTFVRASLSQKLPDWIAARVRARKFFGGVPKAIVCDNLKAAVAKPRWFEPSLTKTFSDMATHYDTTVLPARPRKPRDKGKAEGAVLIVERRIPARLRNRQFFSIEALNVAIAELLDDLDARTMRRVGRSHQRYGGMTPESLITRAARTGYHAAAPVERLMRDRPDPEQGYRSALGGLSLQRQFGADRLEAACERAPTVGTVNHVSVRSILMTGLDRAPSPPDPVTAPPVHDNFRRASGARSARRPGYYR